MSEEDLAPELGDFITIKSRKYGSIVGKIIYRSESLVRVKPRTTVGESGRLYEFPVDPDTNLFQESLGIEEIEIHEKRKHPAFVNQLGILPGLDLQLIRSDGSSEKVRILDIHADEDALVIQRGDAKETLSFDFIGPPSPYVSVEVVVPEAESEPISAPSTSEPVEAPEFDITLLLSPGAVEEIPSSEKIYSSEEQLEDMILSLKTEYTVEEQEKNKGLLKLLQKQATLFLTLKEQTKESKESKESKEAEPITTVLEAIRHQPYKEQPLHSILPVINSHRCIYTSDDTEDAEYVNNKNELEMFGAITTAFEAFEKGTGGFGNRYVEYIKKILQIAPGLQGHGDGTRIHTDQEVFRGPPITIDTHKTKGLVANLPSARNVERSRRYVNKKIDNKYITDIEHQTYRVIGCTTFKDYTTQDKINLADADIFEPLQYLILPPSLARQRCSETKNGVLLWDVHQSEELRDKTNFSKQVISSFSTHPSLESVYNLEESLTIANVIQKYLIQPYYTLSDSYLLYTMDGFGFRQLDWTVNEFDVITHLLDKYQSQWNNTYSSYSKNIGSLVSNKSNSIIGSTIDAKSQLLTSIESNKLIEPIVHDLQSNELHIGKSDLTIANTLHGFVERLWLLNAAAIDNPDMKSQVEAEELIVQSEQTRIQHEKETKISINFELHAEPILNTCEHVKQLELIRGIGTENEDEQMILLEAFISKYREGIISNWIQCNICHKDLLCKHEDILLQEYKSEFSKGILHKTLIIEFGDLQYNDSYICKNCGIVISEIEYANSLDFNKEGVLMQGRSVLDGLEVGDILLSEELTDDKYEEYKKPFRDILQILFENAGANPSESLYKECANFAYAQFLAIKNKFYQQLKGKHSEASILSGLMILVCAATVIIQLQISETELPILFTAQGCTFSRDGYPRDKEGTGLLEYIGCITSRVTITSEPWSSAYWQSKSYGPARTEFIIKYIKYCVEKAIESPTLMDGLQIARQQIEQKEVLEEAPTFRPRIISTSSAISNLTSIELDPLLLRSEVLAHQVIETAHAFAMKSHRPLRGQTKRLDGQCCEIKLSEMNTFGIVGLQPEGVVQELQLIKQGEANLMEQGGVSNMVVPWSAPFSKKAEAASDESVLLRLFLKACASGPTAGLPHEYGYTRTCRRCGFHYPTELLDLTIDEQYYLEKEAGASGKSLEAIRTKLQEITNEKNTALQKVIKDADIHSDKESFFQLQDNINMRYQISVKPVVEIIDWVSLISVFLNTPTAKTVLSPLQQQEWNLFKTFIESSPSESERISKFIPFSGLYPMYKEAIKKHYRTLNCPGGNDKQIEEMLETFRTTHSILTLITGFIQPLQQIASGIKLIIRGSKWFSKNMTTSHKTELDKIWDDQYRIVHTSITNLQTTPDIKLLIEMALNRYTLYIGKILSMFMTSIRVSSTLRENERNELLTWFLLSSIHSLMDPSSTVYASETSTKDLRRRSSKTICCYIILIMNNIIKNNKKINKTSEEITYAIDSRNQAERERFIEKQDKLIKIEDKKADNIFKRLGIGAYSEGALKRQLSYDADYHEFHRNQRAEYGFTDFSADVSGRPQEEIHEKQSSDATLEMVGEFGGQTEEAE